MLGWLRNLDRKPRSLEIPYETGGALRPMFPDLVLVRRVGEGPAAEWRCDILEPHRPDLGDNWERARGLAQFAGKHGHLCGRIELIRKASSGAFQPLDLNREAVRAAVLPISSNPQLDAVFAGLAGVG